MANSVGRPRKQSPRRKGATAREEILDAASELFTRKGFATTSVLDVLHTDLPDRRAERMLSLVAQVSRDEDA